MAKGTGNIRVEDEHIITSVSLPVFNWRLYDVASFRRSLHCDIWLFSSDYLKKSVEWLFIFHCEVVSKFIFDLSGTLYHPCL